MEKYYNLLQIIKEEYDLVLDNSLEQINVLNQYPHMFIICFSSYNLIVKIIKKQKIYFDDINLFYSAMESNVFIEKPQKTKKGHYGVSFKDSIVLIYRELLPIKVNPSSFWWAECLSSIHSSEINSNYHSSFSYKIYDQTITLLNNAEKFMNDEIREKAYTILSRSELKNDKLDVPFVLCHNDPYNLNVMQYGNSYKIIDTDGMGLSPKEYDIQRLLYNQALDCTSIYDLEFFWKNFKTQYENIYSEPINIDVLKMIYSCDLIRSLSWLYIVSNNNERADRKRQGDRLELFKNSIVSDIHTKILKRM